MASLFLKEPVCRKEDCSLIDISTLYRVISSFTDWKPDLLFEFSAFPWKAAIVSSEHRRSYTNQNVFCYGWRGSGRFQQRKPSLVLRYVDSSNNIREEFPGFRRCWEETTGNAIKELKLITNSVRELGLTMDNCRGQCYDGAANMAGRYAGALTLIQHQFPQFMLLLDKFILVETSHPNSWMHVLFCLFILRRPYIKHTWSKRQDIESYMKSFPFSTNMLLISKIE